MELGEPEHAIEAYSKLIRIDPLNPSFYDRRAETCGLKGEYNLAVADYGDAINLNSGDPSRYVPRGIALFALGRSTEAIQDFDQAIKLYEQRVTFLTEAHKVKSDSRDGRQQSRLRLLPIRPTFKSS